MTTDTVGRVFDDQRKAQGFRSQAHLDAFYTYYDHRQACAECSLPGPSVWLFDGWQPTLQECAEGRRLFVLFSQADK